MESPNRSSTKLYLEFYQGEGRNVIPEIGRAYQGWDVTIFDISRRLSDS